MGITNRGGVVVEQGVWGPADLEALGRLYEPLRRFAAVVGRLDVEPDDLVQEACARVMRGDPARIDDLGAYLRRTIANLATDTWRRRSREQDALRRAPVDEATTDEYPSDLADLMRLTPSARGLLFLVEIEGQPTADAAKTVGMTSSAARVALMRARRRLRAEMSAEHADE
jgi:RNA polymerase sigma factor (sigma-70 family)